MDTISYKVCSKCGFKEIRCDMVNCVVCNGQLGGIVEERIEKKSRGIGSGPEDREVWDNM